MKTCSPMEKQMTEVYTRNLFYKFQEELFTTMSLGETIVYEGDVSCKFVVKNYIDEKQIEKEVLWKKDEMHAYCSYNKFEFEGNPCCHVFVYLEEKLYTTFTRLLHFEAMDKGCGKRCICRR